MCPTQTINLALLVSAILARAYPTPPVRRVARPEHDLRHRVKRLWRFLGNGRVGALATQVVLIPHITATPGAPRLLGRAVDWTLFDATLPTGAWARYQGDEEGAAVELTSRSTQPPTPLFARDMTRGPGIRPPRRRRE